MTFRTTQMSTATGELPGKKLSQEPGADTARAWGGRRPRSPPGRPGTASTSASLLLPHLQSQPDLHPAARSPLQSQLPVPHAAGLPQHPHLPPPHPCAELLCPSPLPEAALAQVTPGPRTAPPTPRLWLHSATSPQLPLSLAWAAFLLSAKTKTKTKKTHNNNNNKKH